jgi:hypothetical protein
VDVSGAGFLLGSGKDSAALFGVPNKQSAIPKESVAAGARECSADDRPVVAIVRVILIISIGR